jgi:DNA gyrase/topoisomerase IV subunit B
LVGDSVVGSLGLTAKLNQIVDVNPKIARDASSQYKLKDAYEKPLGVCTIATELVPDRQFDGNTKLKLGNIVDVPTDVVISGRK